MKLLLFVFALVSLEQLAVCFQGNKTADDEELPDWKTLWQNANFSGTRRTRKPKVSPRRQIFRLRMYPNLSTIMKAFEHATKESVYRLEASKVLTSFEEDCMRDPERRSPYEEERLRKPYIIVEADYIILRRHFVAKLSRRIDAVVMKNPPACLYAHRNLFPYTNNLRSAFFSLGEYAISYNVTMEWQHTPVILSGSWADRASYISCKANLAEGLPPPGDEAYIWPKDLLRPDVLIFLHNSTHVSEIPPTSRHYFRVMQLEWYRRLQGPKVAIVNATNYETREALAVHAIKLIQEIAGNETDVSNIPKRVPKHTYRPKSQRKRTYKTRKLNSSTTTTYAPFSNVTIAKK